MGFNNNTISSLTIPANKGILANSEHSHQSNIYPNTLTTLCYIYKLYNICGGGVNYK